MSKKIKISFKKKIVIFTYKDLCKRLPEVVRSLCSQRDALVKQQPEGLGLKSVGAEHSLAICCTLVLQAQQPDIWDLLWSSFQTC